MAESRQEMIESKIDRGTLTAMEVDARRGGLQIKSMAEAAEFAKMMSVSQQAVPPHCRNQPGVCFAITIQAIEWRMSPFSAANKSYVVNDRVGYESQLIHAVIEQRAPITSRLRHSFSGSGPTRRCKVWATPRGETEPVAYESPEFQVITPKNSPLWKSKPDLQLYYNTSRDWARMYFPDVILGVYSDDELEDAIGTVLGQVVTPEPRSLATVAATVAAGHDTRDTIKEPVVEETPPVAEAEPPPPQVAAPPAPEPSQPSPPTERPMGDIRAFADAASKCRTLRGLRELQKSVQWPDEEHELHAAQIVDEASERLRGQPRDLLP